MPQTASWLKRRGDRTISFFSPELAPFSTALLVMLAIGVIELVALLFGVSPSSSIESLLPDVDPPDLADVDGVEGVSAGLSPLSATLGWLSVGRVPILVLFVIFLTAFGLAGYLVQSAAASVFGSALPTWLAALPAALAGILSMRYGGQGLGRIFPRTQTDAASQAEMVGSYATVIRGEARIGQPAEAKTTDLRGRTHYVLIEPAEEADVYGTGTRVFLVKRERNIYKAITRIDTKAVE